ncbi:MAG: DUF177 domain-containing protein [Alphaproteobacteria bacterium]|nr:DUF177 domain-containing protein [Alphaproteobacteria bacterium]
MSNKTETEAETQPLFGARFRSSGPKMDIGQVTVRAGTAELGKLAGLLGISGVDEFRADLEVHPFSEGFKVTGTLQARVQQACVISLEPVPEAIEAKVNRVFMRGRGPDRPAPARDPKPGEYVQPEREDPPDWFESDWVDLDPLLVETLSLSMNPYPRAPGASVKSDESADAESNGAFAALAKLKNP